jgi:hypothetical protein
LYNRDRYTLIHSDVWRSPAFRALSNEARLLYIWSLTNEDSTVSGLYVTTPKRMATALESGWSEESDDFHVALEELGRQPMVLYDFDHEVMWVTAKAREAPSTPSLAKRMQEEVEAVPQESELVTDWWETYREMIEARLATPKPSAKRRARRGKGRP